MKYFLSEHCLCFVVIFIHHSVYLSAHTSPSRNCRLGVLQSHWGEYIRCVCNKNTCIQYTASYLSDSGQYKNFNIIQH